MLRVTLGSVVGLNLPTLGLLARTLAWSSYQTHHAWFRVYPSLQLSSLFKGGVFVACEKRVPTVTRIALKVAGGWSCLRSVLKVSTVTGMWPLEFTILVSAVTFGWSCLRGVPKLPTVTSTGPFKATAFGPSSLPRSVPQVPTVGMGTVGIASVITAFAFGPLHGSGSPF